MVISLKSWRPSGRVHGGWGWIHTVWVTSLFQCTAAQLSITPDVVTAAVGDNVTLSVRYEGRLEDVVWSRSGGTRGDGFILNLFDSDAPPVYGRQSTGRESVLPDGSLQITDVQTDDTGNYTVLMFVNPMEPQVATAQLRVHGAPPASDASCSSWWVTLAVASGMLLGAAVAVLGVVLFYERRAKKANGATRGGSRRFIYEPAVNYENVKKGNPAQPAALKHGDQATYGHLQRNRVKYSHITELIWSDHAIIHFNIFGAQHTINKQHSSNRIRSKSSDSVSAHSVKLPSQEEILIKEAAEDPPLRIHH
ncbi:uncharacterized protein LOC144767869 [Lissotriton helveticus]